MGRAEQASDPSMEEILASIRRIISEDNPEPEAKAGPQLAVVPKPAEIDTPEAEAADETELEAAEPEEESEEPESEPVARLTPRVGVVDANTEDAPEPIAEADALDAAISEVVGEAARAAADPAPRPQSAPRAAAPEPQPRSEPARSSDGLLSPQTNEAVQSAFDQLAHTILGQQSRTLEDLVQELLRPMLRHWLDDNLPVLVERLVREEIERVSRGRR